MKTARNLRADALARASSRPTVSLDDPATPDPKARRTADYDEDAWRLREALKSAEPPSAADHDPLLLDGTSGREIADSLGISLVISAGPCPTPGPDCVVLSTPPHPTRMDTTMDERDERGLRATPSPAWASSLQKATTTASARALPGRLPGAAPDQRGDARADPRAGSGDRGRVDRAVLANRLVRRVVLHCRPPRRPRIVHRRGDIQAGDGRAWQKTDDESCGSSCSGAVGSCGGGGGVAVGAVDGGAGAVCASAAVGAGGPFGS